MNRIMEDVFKKTAREIFDVLIRDFGAVLMEEVELNDCHPTLFTSVRYDLPVLFIRIYREKGAAGVMLAVKGDTEIIRPYRTHQFELFEVVDYLDPERRLNRSPSAFSGGERALLMLFRDDLLKYGAPILRGDLEILEEITIRNY